MGGSAVTKLDFPYLKAHRNRHGNMRYYVRRRGTALVRLPGPPTTPEGFAAYHAAVEAPAAPAKSTSQPAKSGAGRALLSEFYGSDYWRNTLKPITQGNYRNVYERWANEWGANAVATLTRKDVQAMLDDRAATPSAARTFLKRLRILFDFAVEREYRADNPFRTVKLKPLATEGFIAWSDADIERFKARHAPGSKPRRAMALLLYTTQRRSDVHRMAASDVVEGCIAVTQTKGRKGIAPVQLLVPIHPELLAELAQAPEGPAFITTAYGNPFSAAGFTKWFVEQAQAAGLVDRTPHGLRKAGARHHAEAGSGAPQIAAMTGHKSLSEVQRYIRSAAQPRLARLAMDALSPPKVSHPAGESVSPNAK